MPSGNYIIGEVQMPSQVLDKVSRAEVDFALGCPGVQLEALLSYQSVK